MSERLPQGRRLEYLAQYGYTLGSPVMVGRISEESRGAVRYIGSTRFAPGTWIGVELASKSGKNDGSINDHRYFRCEYPHGIFVRPERVKAITNGQDMVNRFEASMTPIPTREPEVASAHPTMNFLEPVHVRPVSLPLVPISSSYDDWLDRSTHTSILTGTVLVHKSEDVRTAVPSCGNWSTGTSERTLPLQTVRETSLGVRIDNNAVLPSGISSYADEQNLLYPARESTCQEKSLALLADDAPDLLAYTPSLVDILSYVNVEDIVKCKLVSKRFNHVIMHNPRSMPKEDVYIEISGLGTTVWKMDIHLTARMYRYEIHDNCVREDRGYWVPRNRGYEATTIKESSSLEEGFVFVLHLLCRKYRLSIDVSRRMCPPVPLSFYAIVGRIYRECSGSSCFELTVDCSDNLDKISALVDAKLTVMEWWTDLHVSHLRPLFQAGTCHRLDVKVGDGDGTVGRLTQHDWITDIIEDWTLHDYHLPKSVMSSVEEGWNDPEGTLYPLLRALDGCQYFEKRDSDDGKLYSYRFSRSADTRLLFLQYFEFDDIYFYDAEPVEPLEFCSYE